MTLNTVHVMANIANQYNAQNFDSITGTTTVSDTDIQLLKVIQDLYAVISDMKQQVTSLTDRVLNLENELGLQEDESMIRDANKELY